jgi:hypothetical protein
MHGADSPRKSAHRGQQTSSKVSQSQFSTPNDSKKERKRMQMKVFIVGPERFRSRHYRRHVSSGFLEPQNSFRLRPGTKRPAANGVAL